MVWESKKILAAQRTKASGSHGGIWMAGSFWREGKTPGFVERNAGDGSQTFTKLNSLLPGSQYFPEERREATPF